MLTSTSSAINCKKCRAVGWIEATPLGKRNYQKVVCGKCGKKNHIITRKWGKTIQF